MELQFERAQLLVSAGLLDAALECMSEVKRQAPQNPRVLMEYVTLLSKLGKVEEIQTIEQEVKEQQGLRGASEVLRLTAQLSKPGCVACTGQMVVEKYTHWILDEVKPVSKHSAVFRFSCKDKQRQTPKPTPLRRDGR